MATALQFEDLNVWKDARRLIYAVYVISNMRAFGRDFGLRDQIRRAAVSTMSNIAEGFERGTRKEFMQFLNIATGSNGEVRSQLQIALDLKYIGEKDFVVLRESTMLLSRKLSAFIRYLERYHGNSRMRKVEDRLRENLQLSTSNLQP